VFKKSLRDFFRRLTPPRAWLAPFFVLLFEKWRWDYLLLVLDNTIRKPHYLNNILVIGTKLSSGERPTASALGGQVFVCTVSQVCVIIECIIFFDIPSY